MPEVFDKPCEARVKEMVGVLWSDIQNIPEMERTVIVADLLAKVIANLKMPVIERIKISRLVLCGVEAQTLNEIEAVEKANGNQTATRN